MHPAPPWQSACSRVTKTYAVAMQTPMDLGTVSQRLESNYYASASAAADDVCLVWRNCQAFNEPGSDVYQSCDELSGIFDQLWKQAKLPPPTVRFLLYVPPDCAENDGSCMSCHRTVPAMNAP